MKWKLAVNCKKTKVVIFNGNKKDYKNMFYLGELQIYNVVSYNYFGVIFHKSNKYLLRLETCYVHKHKRQCILFYDKADVTIFLMGVNQKYLTV